MAKKQYYQLAFDKKNKEVLRIKVDSEITNKNLFVFGAHFNYAKVDLYKEFVNAQVYSITKIKHKWKPDIYFFTEQCEYLTLLIKTYEEKVRHVKY